MSVTQIEKLVVRFSFFFFFFFSSLFFLFFFFLSARSDWFYSFYVVSITNNWSVSTGESETLQESVGN